MAAALAGLTTLGCGSGGTKKTNVAATGAPVAPPVKLTASYVGGIGPEGGLFAAINQGIFQKNALDVTMTQITGTNAIAALLAGNIQVADAGGGEALASAVQGTDIVVVAVATPVYTGELYVSPEIKSPSDLKGKKLGIALPGGTGDQTLRQALLKLGLQPDKDVTLVSTGSLANQSAALLSGAIQGTNISPGPESAKLQAAGIKPLVDFASLGLPPAATVATSMRRSFIAARHDVAQKYVDSLVQGTALFRKDRAVGLKALATAYKSDDQAGLAAAYDYTNRDATLPLEPLPKSEQFQALQDVLCKSRKIEAACSFDLTKAYDASLVQSAVKRGLAK